MLALLQSSCQLGAGNFASNINWFSDLLDDALLWAPHKKAPACAFEGRHVLPAAAKRASFRDRVAAATYCDCLRSAVPQSDGTVIAELIANRDRLNDERHSRFHPHSVCLRLDRRARASGSAASSRGNPQMKFAEFKKAGHWPTLLAAFLYFDISFMAWVAL